jgi:hypothetical protein
MVNVSLDSPSCEVALFDPVYRWFIGTLPDRPRDYTVWSTLEPLGLDSRTWAGIIQVGSATAGIRAIISTTSSRGSFLATSPLLSCPPATGTPTPSLGAPPPASVRRRPAASALLFHNTGHPYDRREPLNLSPHFPLAAGEPPLRNLIGTDRLSCVARPRIQLQGFESFQGPFCRKSEPPPIQISQLVKSIGNCRKI